MPARRKPEPQPGETAPSFEECLAELESIVDAMENDRLPLEDLVARYEKGIGLLRSCETALATARERIELINLRSQAGENGHAAPDSPPSAAQDDESDDDIRLF